MAVGYDDGTTLLVHSVKWAFGYLLHPKAKLRACPSITATTVGGYPDERGLIV
jgi:hypothetical protein